MAADPKKKSDGLSNAARQNLANKDKTDAAREALKTEARGNLANRDLAAEMAAARAEAQAEVDAQLAAAKGKKTGAAPKPAQPTTAAGGGLLGRLKFWGKGEKKPDAAPDTEGMPLKPGSVIAVAATGNTAPAAPTNPPIQEVHSASHVAAEQVANYLKQKLGDNNIGVQFDRETAMFTITLALAEGDTRGQITQKLKRAGFTDEETKGRAAVPTQFVRWVLPKAEFNDTTVEALSAMMEKANNPAFEFSTVMETADSYIITKIDATSEVDGKTVPTPFTALFDKIPPNKLAEKITVQPYFEVTASKKRMDAVMARPQTAAPAKPPAAATPFAPPEAPGISIFGNEPPAPATSNDDTTDIPVENGETPTPAAASKITPITQRASAISPAKLTPGAKADANPKSPDAMLAALKTIGQGSEANYNDGVFTLTFFDSNDTRSAMAKVIGKKGETTGFETETDAVRWVINKANNPLTGDKEKDTAALSKKLGIEVTLENNGFDQIRIYGKGLADIDPKNSGLTGVSVEKQMRLTLSEAQAQSMVKTGPGRTMG